MKRTSRQALVGRELRRGKVTPDGLHDLLIRHCFASEKGVEIPGRFGSALVDRVHGVRESEVPGLYVVDIEKDGQKVPVFLDAAGQYLISGNVIRLSDMTNLTQQYHAELNRIDISRVPVEDALLLGNPSAATKVIVFTDPQCPFCSKLHAELQKVVARDPEIAFLIKMFPLKMHPEAYCDTKAVDATLDLVEQIGIRSTPTLVLPDGRVVPGFKKADELLLMLGSRK